MAAAGGRITAGVGANLIGQHAQDRNQEATIYVGNLDPQVRCSCFFSAVSPCGGAQMCAGTYLCSRPLKITAVLVDKCIHWLIQLLPHSALWCDTQSTQQSKYQGSIAGVHVRDGL